MKPKIFNTAFAAIAFCLATSLSSFAQNPAMPAVPATPATPATPIVVTVDPVVTVLPNTSAAVSTKALKLQIRKINAQVKKLTITTNAQVIAAVKSINANVDADVDAVAPQVNAIVSNTVNHSYTISNDDADLVKNYSKTYSVDANDVLSIENKYGSVVVNTWNRNEIKIDVQIKVSADDADASKKLLDNVNISDSKNGSSIAFRTVIGDTKNSWYSNLFGGNSSRHMEINYTVYMPAKNELVLDDRYGAIVLPELSGKVTINSAYGSLRAKSLNSESTLRVKYGNANIDNLDDCTIQLSYGELVIGTVNQLTADVSYSPIKIGKLNTAGTINLRYGGGLKIGDLSRAVKNLAISASYSNVDIGLSGDETADFAVVTRYGDFNYGEHSLTITSKSPNDDERGFHPTKSYQGYIGKANSGKNITINTSYGNVKFE